MDLRLYRVHVHEHPSKEIVVEALISPSASQGFCFGDGMFTIAVLSFIGSIGGYRLADIALRKAQAKKAGKVRA